jgi:hypothetical protein
VERENLLVNPVASHSLELSYSYLSFLSEKDHLIMIILAAY